MDDQTEALIDQLLERVIDLEHVVATLSRQYWNSSLRKSLPELVANRIIQRDHDQEIYDKCQTPNAEKSKPSSADRS